MAKKKKLDHLARDVLADEKAGMSYGQFKANNPHTYYEGEDREPEQEPGKERKYCMHCGMEFYASPWQTNKLYCSAECQKRHYAEKEKQRRNNREWKKRSGKPAVCPICGGDFVSIRGSKYCGTDCYIEAMRTQAKERNRKRRERRASGKA